MPIIDAIVKRRSIREFAATEVAEADAAELITAAQFAPTSEHNRAVEFVVVRSQAVRDAIFQVVGQDFVKQAPLLIVPVHDPAKSHQPIQDLSIASAHILLQAAALGLGSVWKHLMPGCPDKVKEILGIPADRLVINLLPIGWPKRPLPPHDDRECAPQAVHREKW